MENKKNKLNRISVAKFPARFFSFVIDIAIVMLVSIILYFSCTSTVLYDSMGGKKTWNKFMSFCDESSLYVTEKDANGDYTSKLKPLSYDAVADSNNKQGQPGYSLFFEKISDFYVDFLPNNSNIDDIAGKKPSEYYTVKYFNQEIMDLPKIESNLYEEGVTDIADRHNFYQYKVNETTNEILFNELPVLTKEVQNLVDKNDDKILTELNEYFFKSTGSKSVPTGIYITAVETLTKQSYPLNILSEYNNIKYACRAVTTIPPLVIFFFVIPLCMPNGETLGKLILGLGVCSKNGYEIPMYLRILRPLYMTAILGLPYYFPSKFTAITMAVCFALLMLDYIFMVIDKSMNNACLHDRLFKTIVYNKKRTTIFKNQQAEEAFNATHPDFGLPEQNNKQLSDSDLCKIEREYNIIDLDTLKKHKEIIDSIETFDAFEKKDL